MGVGVGVHLSVLLNLCCLNNYMYVRVTEYVST